MTDEQLALLLSAMLDDLERVLDDVRERMPEEAERGTSINQWQMAPEYATTVEGIVLKAIGHWEEVPGDYVALEPLTEWLAKWRERVEGMGERDE